MDFLSPTERSRRMSLIRKKHTKPERIVRRIAHRLGYRFRLHRSDLPGTPDLVFPRLMKIIDVRGCFWHLHHCRTWRLPARRRAYWAPKLERNRQRDRRSIRKLRAAGWQVLVVWECETKNAEELAMRINLFLRKTANRRRGSKNESHRRD
jgi:DNA mismatch endonuclease, patch repair protein